MRILHIATVCAVMITSGIVYGLWIDRWSPSPEPRAAAARLADLPMAIGEWQGETLPFEEGPRGTVGCLARRYRNQVSGATVSVLLVCGRPGPVSVHTPDVCYSGAGYDPTAPPTRYTMPRGSVAGPAEFWTADLQEVGAAVPARLRIYWGWSATGSWTAPDNPRLAFARFPALYKLYVLRDGTGGSGRQDADPCTAFLPRLLAELDQCLFPPA